MLSGAVVAVTLFPQRQIFLRSFTLSLHAVDPELIR